jgi:hypothetical protein
MLSFVVSVTSSLSYNNTFNLYEYLTGNKPNKMTWSKLVVGAIDFGTTFSGYTFSFVHDYGKKQ